MTAPPAVRSKVSEHTAAVLADLALRRVDLASLATQMEATETDLFNIGTSYQEVYRAVSAFRIARDHVNSAWRSLDYATRNLTEQTGTPA